jgi:hypothetical protein
MPRELAGSRPKTRGNSSWYRDASAPESKDAFEEIARFFDKHLGK